MKHLLLIFILSSCAFKKEEGNDIGQLDINGDFISDSSQKDHNLIRVPKFINTLNSISIADRSTGVTRLWDLNIENKNEFFYKSLVLNSFTNNEIPNVLIDKEPIYLDLDSSYIDRNYSYIKDNLLYDIEFTFNTEIEYAIKGDIFERVQYEVSFYSEGDYKTLGRDYLHKENPVYTNKFHYKSSPRFNNTKLKLANIPGDELKNYLNGVFLLEITDFNLLRGEDSISRRDYELDNNKTIKHTEIVNNKFSYNYYRNYNHHDTKNILARLDKSFSLSIDGFPAKLHGKSIDGILGITDPKSSDTSTYTYIRNDYSDSLSSHNENSKNLLTWVGKIDELGSKEFSYKKFKKLTFNYEYDVLHEFEDLKTPIKVEPNSKLSIRLYLRNPREQIYKTISSEPFWYEGSGCSHCPIKVSCKLKYVVEDKVVNYSLSDYKNKHKFIITELKNPLNDELIGFSPKGELRIIEAKPKILKDIYNNNQYALYLEFESSINKSKHPVYYTFNIKSDKWKHIDYGTHTNTCPADKVSHTNIKRESRVESIRADLEVHIKGGSYDY